MGKALILDADFSAVALDTVAIVQDPIPCTDITLSQDTATFTNVGDTVTITAALEPIDTTDTVTWTSSNDNVATVSASGVITIHGLGTATITATCGTQTATVSINQTTLRFMDISTVEAYKAMSYSPAMGLASSSGDISIGKEYTGNDRLRIYRGESKGLEAIPVPYGTTSVTIISSERKYWSDLLYADSNVIATYSGGNYPTYINKYSGFYTDVAKTVSYGQCIILSASSDKASLVSGLLFQ